MDLAEIAGLPRAQDHPNDDCEGVISLPEEHIEQVARRTARPTAAEAQPHL